MQTTFHCSIWIINIKCHRNIVKMKLAAVYFKIRKKKNFKNSKWICQKVFAKTLPFFVEKVQTSFWLFSKEKRNNKNSLPKLKCE